MYLMLAKLGVRDCSDLSAYPSWPPPPLSLFKNSKLDLVDQGCAGGLFGIAPGPDFSFEASA
jgi:hypothetical protein